MAGAMRWLVDGMNVVGSRPDGWWRDRRSAMRGLARLLDEFAERTGDEVAVVFDGRPFELEQHGNVEVGFASGRRGAADDAIAERVAADPDPGSLTVVTSDAELADRVRRSGAEVAASGSFRRRLESG
jgi:predicted RNA-binding protein with PIN domain